MGFGGKVCEAADRSSEDGDRMVEIWRLALFFPEFVIFRLTVWRLYGNIERYKLNKPMADL
jgi:hypothetical protein